MKNFFYVTVCMLMCSMIFSNCKPNATDDPTSADGALYNLLKTQTFTNYKGQDVILEPKGSSPHGPFKLKFNAVALAALDSLGKLPVGATFPDSAIVLKEVYDNNNKLKQLVPMMRMRNDPNSANGWLWGQYDENGKIIYSVTSLGGKCVSCHKSVGNRDLTLSFDLH